MFIRSSLNGIDHWASFQVDGNLHQILHKAASLVRKTTVTFNEQFSIFPLISLYDVL